MPAHDYTTLMVLNQELEHVIFLVKKSKPKNPGDVQIVIDAYFKEIVWSLLKEEYEVSMTDAERRRFAQAMFADILCDDPTLHTSEFGFGAME